jgi:hypothetical protein
MVGKDDKPIYQLELADPVKVRHATFATHK